MFMHSSRLNDCNYNRGTLVFNTPLARGSICVFPSILHLFILCLACLAAFYG